MMLSTGTLQFVIILALCLHGGEAVNPKRKTWWATRITDDLYSAGRLTETQIKFAVENGFRTMISIYDFPEEGTFGGELLPSTTRARYVATRLAGMDTNDFKWLLEMNAAWITEEVVHKFTAFVEAATKPVLFFCTNTYSVSYISLLYVANETKIKGEEASAVADKFYETANYLGFDYAASDEMRTLTSTIIGASPTRTFTPSSTLSDWSVKYWPLKPFYKQWYVAGQIQENHLKMIEDAGILSVINSRAGAATLQEEVVLLNIKDGTGANRQSEEQLQANIIDPDKPNTYISNTSDVNYQARSPAQFGDDIGYNETIERLAFQDTALNYHFTPLTGPNKYTVETFNKYKDTIQRAAKEGPVLLHSRTGYRSAVLAVAMIADMEDKTSAWALNQCLKIGYDFSADETVVQLFKDFLDQPDIDMTTVSTTPSSSISVLNRSVTSSAVWIVFAFWLSKFP